MTSEAFSQCLKGNLPEDTCKKVMLREIIRAETEANNIYEPIIDYFDSIEYDTGVEVVKHINKEEKEHHREVEDLLEDIDPEFEDVEYV